MLRGQHDGPHADVLRAARFLEARERFGLWLGFTHDWRELGWGPGSDARGRANLALASYHCWTWFSVNARDSESQFKVPEGQLGDQECFV